MNLFLSKNIELDDKETVVMAILNGLYSNKNENLYISTSLLGYAITGRFLNVKNQKDRTIITGIKDGIDSLIKKEIIEIIDCDKDNYILSSKGLTVNTEKEKYTDTNRDNTTRTLSKSGDIGIQTPAWSIKQDVDLWRNWNYVQEVFEDILSLIALQIY